MDILFIGGTGNISTDFICELLPEMEAGLKGDKFHSAVLDNSKIRQFVPGFSCRKSLRAGLHEAVDWLRAHPEDRAIDPRIGTVSDAVIGAWRGRMDST